MSYDTNEKLELLWKRYRSVSPTSNNKAAHNEALLSIQPTFQQNFWTDSDLIPVPALADVLSTGNESWAATVQPKKQSNAVRMVMDPTAELTAFHAMEIPSMGILEENRIRNWVPPTIDRSYNIFVWAGNPADSAVSAQRLYPGVDGFEWEFDYSTGVLFFPNGIPSIAKQNGVFIEGWIYVGEIGRQGSNAGNTSRIRTLMFTTSLLAPGIAADFTLDTGGHCTLVEAKVTGPSILECHAMSSRDDTNPYRFIGVNGHLVDDGSFSVAGMRYYGERFVQLVNMEDDTLQKTYWRVTNNTNYSQQITVIVKVI